MKRFLLLAAVLVALAGVCSATVSVTVHATDLASAPADQTTVIVSTLRGCGSNVPRVIGTGIVEPLTKTWTLDGTGSVTMTLYSTNDVSCGGLTGVTYYDILVQNAGSDIYKASYTFCSVAGANCSSVGDVADLSTVPPNTIAPVVAAPSGDSTYPRLDGGNSATPFAGNWNFTGNNAFTGQLNAAQAPRYLWANVGKYWAWNFARASRSQAFSVGTGGVMTPVGVMRLGDSITGLSPAVFMHEYAEHMPLNAIGYTNFASLNGAIWGSNITFSMSGCVAVTGDNSSLSNWGPGGSRIDCSGSWSIAYAPAAQFRFDTFYLAYLQAASGISVNWNIDGGTNTPFSTTGTPATLGFLSAQVNGGSASASHTVNITGTGAATFYGIGTSQRAQPGFVLHTLQTGGTQLAQWAALPSFTQQLIADLAPAEVLARLGTNDAGTGAVSAATFGTNLTSFVNALNLPATTHLVVATNTPRGTNLASPPSTCPDDPVANGLLEQYRTQIFNLATTLGYSVFDERRAWPGATATYTSYVQGCQLGLFTDLVHPSTLGTAFMAQNEAAALFQTVDTPSRELAMVRNQGMIMMPAAHIASASFGSNGSITDTGTGFSFPTSTAVDVSQGGVRYWRFGFNENSINALNCYPTSGNPTCFFGYRQGSISAQAWKLTVNSDGSSQIDVNNSALVVSVSGTEKFRVNSNGVSAVGLRSNNSANTDLTGRVTLAGGSGAFTLTGTYTSAPNCVCADTTAPANSCSVSESTTALTFTGTGTDVVKYLCDGRN